MRSSAPVGLSQIRLLCCRHSGTLSVRAFRETTACVSSLVTAGLSTGQRGRAQRDTPWSNARGHHVARENSHPEQKHRCEPGHTPDEPQNRIDKRAQPRHDTTRPFHVGFTGRNRTGYICTCTCAPRYESIPVHVPSQGPLAKKTRSKPSVFEEMNRVDCSMRAVTARDFGALLLSRRLQTSPTCVVPGAWRLTRHGGVDHFRHALDDRQIPS